MSAARKPHRPRPDDAAKARLSTLVATKAHQQRLAAGRTERAPNEPLSVPIPEDAGRRIAVRRRIEELQWAREIGCAVEDFA